MARYIDAEKISIHIRENFSIDKTKNADICFAFIDFMNWLDEQPTVDVVEVKHGEWSRGTEPSGSVYAHCSACNRKMNSYCYGYAHCPLYGARMDGRSDT